MFYDRFVSACKKINRSPSSVALDLGASKSNITNWKNGASPSADIIIRAALYLGVTSDYLLSLSDYMTTDEEHNLENITETKADPLALEVYRKLSECLLAFKTVYSEKYNLYNNSNFDEEEIFPMNRILCKHLIRIITNYVVIADDLLDGEESEKVIIDAVISESSNLELLMEEVLKILSKRNNNK